VTRRSIKQLTNQILTSVRKDLQKFIAGKLRENVDAHDLYNIWLPKALVLVALEDEAAHFVRPLGGHQDREWRRLLRKLREVRG